MRRLLFPLALATVFLLPFTGPASALPCGGGADVTSLSGGCDLGGVHFDNFAVSLAGGLTSATLFVSDLSHDNNGGVPAADLVFQVSHAPSPTVTAADVLLTYSASGGPLTGIDLSNGGTGVTIQEVACSQAFEEAACGGTTLATLVVGPGAIGSAAFTDPTSSVFIRKDIQFAAGGFLSDFENSHELETPTATPEPATLLLFGSTLTGLGWAWRKRRG